MFYACKCSLDLSIHCHKNIQSPAVTRCRIPGIFCHQIQIEETDRIPGNYLVTIFLFGRFIRQENPSYWFLKGGNNITVIFTKSTRYCVCLNHIIPVEVLSKFADREPKSEKWSEEIHKGKKKLFMFILLNLLYSVLTR